MSKKPRPSARVKYTPINCAVVMDMYGNGASVEQIARELNIQKVDLLVDKMIAAGAEIEPVQSRGGGRRVGIDYMEVDRLLRAGMSLKQIAVKIGRAYSTIWDGLQKRGMVEKNERKCRAQQKRRDRERMEESK